MQFMLSQYIMITYHYGSEDTIESIPWSTQQPSDGVPGVQVRYKAGLVGCQHLVVNKLLAERPIGGGHAPSQPVGLKGEGFNGHWGHLVPPPLIMTDQTGFIFHRLLSELVKSPNSINILLCWGF